ncbi:MotA/TolQ/ExbB proton channel family protein [Corticibacter populi]|uniref:Biopolymer transport protein ExbB n=1 Tax=Corticibacter populi TaxID=1550736 RepID=A0A3M6QS32_9BURK|nr:MotA/TolQ/ExbB proton channel family protein [Corticibacter populi]RMX05855.1 MotA/TolQ/ExbB proton channel family protein [Corticibacter populi]RZS30827.1 outer membrane transport energization protein ExbB [Corticibacter populi]
MKPSTSTPSLLPQRLLAAALLASLLAAPLAQAQDNPAPPPPPEASATAPSPTEPGATAEATPATTGTSASAPAATATAVPTAATAAPAAAPGSTQSIEVENPYGLKAIWEQGDLVAKITLFILVLMSAASWYVILAKLIEQSRLQARARHLKRSFWQQAEHSGLPLASSQLKRSSEFRFIADAGLIAQQQYAGALTQEVDRNSWLSQSIGEAIDAIGERLQGGLAVLATVGSTAPFVGLFGTVWGIYHALTAIGIAGQASIDKVAGPVGEALIMTAIGLAVAVPAVLGYNWLIRRNKAALDEVKGFGTELHTVLLGGKAANTLTGGH